MRKIIGLFENEIKLLNLAEMCRLKTFPIVGQIINLENGENVCH
jgi:hypothetical protein